MWWASQTIRGNYTFGRDRACGQPLHTRRYVLQDDLLNAHLTVEETLAYAAQLRLPRGLGEAEREARVEEVIAACELARCQGTVVGSPLRKGVSGGERKRLSVALELLCRPRLLFLDEPTSGLDAGEEGARAGANCECIAAPPPRPPKHTHTHTTHALSAHFCCSSCCCCAVTAHSLMSRLRQLADQRACAIVCTIHQPSAKIFSLFSKLILLQARAWRAGSRACMQRPLLRSSTTLPLLHDSRSTTTRSNHPTHWLPRRTGAWCSRAPLPRPWPSLRATASPAPSSPTQQARAGLERCHRPRMRPPPPPPHPPTHARGRRACSSAAAAAAQTT